MEKYQVHKQIGSGAFSSVSKATNKTTSEVVAIKKMKKKFSNWDECLSLNEIKLLTKLKHPNLIKLIEVIRSNDELFCVFEYAQQTLYSLYLSYKEKGLPVPESLIRSFIYQTVQGLTYMHKNGFFHRDMKPENLLLSEGNIVKIADFGLAREIRSRPPYTDYVSTRWYRAPELLLKSQNYNSPVDIYALGCIMAELYNQSPLFAGSSEIDQLNKICSVLGTPSYSSWNDGMLLASKIHYNFPQFTCMDLTNVIPSAGDVALSLIKDMLNLDPFKRPTAIQILQHSYFNEISIPNGLYDKRKEGSPNQIVKKNHKFIIKDKRLDLVSQKSNNLIDSIKENEDIQRDSIKTPADSPEIVNPMEIFRKIKKKDENDEEKTNQNPINKLDENSFELEKEEFNEPEMKNSYKKNEKEGTEIKNLLNKRPPQDNPISTRELPNMRTSFGNKKGQAFTYDEDEKEFSHSVSPVKQYEKVNAYNESSLDRNKDFEFSSNKSKEINLFQKKQGTFLTNNNNTINNSVFHSKQFTDFKGNMDVKPKLNLPKLSPIGNVKDIKEKSDFGSIFQPENNIINNNSKFFVQPKSNDMFTLMEDNNSNNNNAFGFKSVLFAGNNNGRLPELQKMNSNNKMTNSYLNQKEENKLRISPNKKIVNLDPIQYSGLKD